MKGGKQGCDIQQNSSRGTSAPPAQLCGQSRSQGQGLENTAVLLPWVKGPYSHGLQVHPGAGMGVHSQAPGTSEKHVLSRVSKHQHEFRRRVKGLQRSATSICYHSDLDRHFFEISLGHQQESESLVPPGMQGG